MSSNNSPAAPQPPRRRSMLEAILDQHIMAYRLPKPEPEYVFHPTRKWRFDRAWPEFRLAVEIEGLMPPWLQAGRHQRSGGYTGDCEKYNEATLLGWKVLRFTREQILRGSAPGGAIRTIARALELASGSGVQA